MPQEKFSLINSLPLTKIKIFIAKLLYRITILFYGNNKRIINRNGIVFEIDISEGIDFSLFLFGSFQKQIIKTQFLKLPENAIIFDVGANIGIMSLYFAQASPSGRVYSFEPTHYALSKFKINLELNPKLAKIIYPVNAFVSDKTGVNTDIIAFSSWKIDKTNSEDNQHAVHLGIAKSTEGVETITLDDFCKSNNIERLDFIKIDTDGHEFKIFKGAKETIAKYKPKIVFEIGIYLIKERNISFDFYYDFFNSINYQMVDIKGRNVITINNYLKYIPVLGTTDICAVPK